MQKSHKQEQQQEPSILAQMMEVWEMKYLGECNYPLHHFPSCTREYGEKHIKIKDKDKDFPR